MRRRVRRRTIGPTLVLIVLALIVIGSISAGVVTGRERASGQTPAPADEQPPVRAASEADATPAPSSAASTAAASASPSSSPSSGSKGSSSQDQSQNQFSTPTMTPGSVEEARAVQIPVLMYHHIAPSPGGDQGYLWVSPTAFAEQMRWLHAEGYEAVTLAQVFDFWEDAAPLPKKPVVITFDDGLRDTYTEAAPVLEKYGWKGVLNINTWAIGGADYAMTRGQMMRLVKRGWEVGCHSTSHRDMTTLNQAELEEETALARHRIEFLLKTDIEFFCYPGGAYDDAVIEAVKEAGYRGATSVDRGLARWGERWRLRRITPTESGLNLPST